MSGGTLRDAGFRFVLRDTNWDWIHPLEVLPTDVDCTDMGDDEFEAHVRQMHGVFCAPTAVVQATAAKDAGSAA